MSTHKFLKLHNTTIYHSKALSVLTRRSSSSSTHSYSFRSPLPFWGGHFFFVALDVVLLFTPESTNFICRATSTNEEALATSTCLRSSLERSQINLTVPLKLFLRVLILFHWLNVQMLPQFPQFCHHSHLWMVWGIPVVTCWQPPYNIITVKTRDRGGSRRQRPRAPSIWLLFGIQMSSLSTP